LNSVFFNRNVFDLCVNSSQHFLTVTRILGSVYVNARIDFLLVISVHSKIIGKQ